MSRRWWQAAGWILLGVGLAVAASLMVNSTFMFYDDEGYVLISLRHFLEGRKLYTEVFSQYGPFPYVYHWLITASLDQPLTHMLGRHLTALHWTACGLLAGFIAQQLSARLSVGIAAAGITFALLWQMSSEPSHPGSLISLLVAGGGLLVIRLPASGRPAVLLAALGAIAAALSLTKINIGLFFVSSVGAILLLHAAWPPRLRTPARFLAAAGLLALPWGLMFGQRDNPDMLLFAVQFSAAAAGLLWVAPRPETPVLAPRAAIAALLGYLAALVMIILVPVWRGTGFADLAGAALFSPLRHPAHFNVPFNWVARFDWVPVWAWSLTIAAGWRSASTGPFHHLVRWLVLLTRLVALGCFLWHLWTWPTVHALWEYFELCLPLTPLFVIPLGPAADGRRLSLLALLALPQVLHAFPVAGSQLGWGSFLLVPLFVCGTFDAFQALGSRVSPLAAKRLALGGGALLAAAGLVVSGLLLREGWRRQEESRPLGLPGAEGIMLDGKSRVTLRLLALNAQIHADLLFSRPGMYSHNLWSGVPTPTLCNATHWFWLLNEGEQRAIISRLEQTPQRAIINNRALDEFVEKIGVSMASPLQSHLQAAYRRLFRCGDFEFWVPRESGAVPFGRIEMREADTGAASQARAVMLQTRLALVGRPMGAALERINAPWETLVDFAGPAVRGMLEPINREDRPLGAPVAFPADRPLRGLYRLTLFHDAFPLTQVGDSLILNVRDDTGRVMAEATFFEEGDAGPPAADSPRKAGAAGTGPG